MATFISDRFDSVGGEDLIGHVANVGSAWLDYNTLSGWTDGVGYINAGEGEVGWNSSRGLTRSPATPGNAFGQYDMICRFVSAGDGALAIGGRWSTGTATGYLVQVEESGPAAIYLRRYDSGTIAGISTSTTYSPWTSNKTLSLKFEDLGGGTHRISALVDGATILSIDDSSPISGPGSVLIGGRNARSTDFIAADTVSGDTTAPTLTSASASGGTLTCSASVSTNEGNGTLYTVFTASSSVPTAVQVEAGQDHTGSSALRAVSQAVSATGSQSVASGSISAGTRYGYLMHKDAAGNRSSVASTGSFSVVSGGGGSAPTVTTNPSNQTVVAGSAATFTAAATGTPTPTVQWQRNGVDISGATSTSYTTPATTISGGSANNGDLFRAVFTNASGTATSNVATLTVTGATGGASITSEPLKRNNTASVGVVSFVYVGIRESSTGASVAVKSGISTNASGVFSVTDPGMISGITYRLDWKEFGGAIGTAEAVAS